MPVFCKQLKLGYVMQYSLTRQNVQLLTRRVRLLSLLLLLLRSPDRSLGFIILSEICCTCYWGFFFNPTIEVVSFRHRGWCMLGVFLSPALTRLEQERQDLLSPCDGMHVCTD